MLIAALIDEVRNMEHLYVSAHVPKGKAGKPPEPLPRPGVARGKRQPFQSRLTDEQRRKLDPRLRVVRDGEAG